VFSQDTSQGYGLHFFDTRKLQWDKNMAKEMGISLDLMPDIYSPSQVVGWVTKSAALLTGIREGVPVVAGGLDAACSALGAGVSASGETQCQGGSAGGMSLCLDSPIMHPKLILSPHVVPGCWLLQGGTVGGGGVLRWLKDNVLDGVSYEEMSWLAAESEPGSVVFLPYMAGERSPIWNTNAKGVFFGLDYAKNKGSIIRAAMEGVAFSLRHNIETAAEAGVSPRSMNLVGGIANSPVWMQILADVTGLNLYSPSSDTGTNLGAAILAGVKPSADLGKRYKPVTRPEYEKNYAVYKELYTSLKHLMK